MGRLWNGDFSSADLSQWTSSDKAAADRLTVVDAPQRPGTKALRVLLKQGDIVFSGCRAEVVREPEGAEGEERWYRWSTLFPADFPVLQPWQVFTQWHQNYDASGHTVGSSPPVEFAIEKDRLQLNTNSADGTAHTWWTAPIPRGQWMDFLFHVKWSSNPAVGFIELDVNGVHVLPKSMVATRFAGMPLPNYLKHGLYRSKDIVPDAVIFHQGMQSFDAPPVALAPAPPAVTPPAPTPAPIPTVAASPSKVVVTMSDGRSIVFKPE